MFDPIQYLSSIIIFAVEVDSYDTVMFLTDKPSDVTKLFMWPFKIYFYFDRSYSLFVFHGCAKNANIWQNQLKNNESNYIFLCCR